MSAVSREEKEISSKLKGILNKLSTDEIELIREVLNSNKRIEEQLKHAEKISRAWLESSPICSKIVDLDFNLQYMSYAGVKSLNIKNIEEFYGKPYPFYFYPESFQKVMTDNLTKVRDTGDITTQVAAVVDLDGNELWFHSTLTPIRDDKGRVSYIIIISIDVTEQKLAEQELTVYREHLETLVDARTSELSIARDKAEHANEAKSEFLNSMSHELRTPLNSILGFSQLLESDTNLISSQVEEVSEIRHAGKHLLELVNETLDLARIESGNFNLKFKEVNLQEVLNECLALVAPIAQDFEIEIPTSGNCIEPVSVYADHMRLKQVILNLLTNGIKYNRTGGRITIQWSRLITGKIRLSITDTGKGIASDRITDIFEPFNRLNEENNEVEGTGIGLTISKKIMLAMSGAINVESEEGKGSTFYLDLVQYKAGLGLEGQTGIENVDSHCGKKQEDAPRTILYIEDDRSSLYLVEAILKQMPNYNLISAIRPEQGLELACQYVPDLILLDINLPGMNGYQVLDKLSALKETKDIPVIAITANLLAGNGRPESKSDFKDYLIKPIDVNSFLNTLEQWVWPSD